MSDRITIVSGLPRSGTSTTMQMLAAAGVEAITDSVREADKDNPHGYYELEIVKKLSKDSSWLQDAKGKVVKVVSPLLPMLPGDFDYDVIFMRRDLDEIVASQARMIQHRESEGAAIDNEKLIRAFKNHLKDVYIWIGGQANVRAHTVRYHDLIEQPAETAASLVGFLGGDLSATRMISAIDTDLYRNRATRT